MLTTDRRNIAGFTLIEMSIVLVIIGLIVGGVLVGQDLISAAAVRAQITQIEKYNTAVNTFYGKYNSHLPGDIPNPDATNFGFLTRGQYPGEGDGNGKIEGLQANTSGMNGDNQPGTGESAMFWVDLSTANLIDGGFSKATPTSAPQSVSGGGPVTPTSSPNIGAFFPAAKIGRGNYIYVDCCGWSGNPSINVYSISLVTQIGYGCSGCLYSVPGLTVTEAYKIDAKIDDGLPQSGAVEADYVSVNISGGSNWAWAAGGGVQGAYVTMNSYWSNIYGPSTAQTSGSATTCYDNRASTSGAVMQYSTEINNGSNINCALSFQFQ